MSQTCVPEMFTEGITLTRSSKNHSCFLGFPCFLLFFLLFRAFLLSFPKIWGLRKETKSLLVLVGLLAFFFSLQRTRVGGSGLPFMILSLRSRLQRNRFSCRKMHFSDKKCLFLQKMQFQGALARNCRKLHDAFKAEEPRTREPFHKKRTNFLKNRSSNLSRGS